MFEDRVAPLATAVAAAVAVAVAGCSSDPAGGPLPDRPDTGPASSTTSVAASLTVPGSGVPATVVRLAPARPAPADKPLLDGYQRFWVGLTDAYRTGRTAGLVDATVEPARGRYVRRASELQAASQTQRGTVLGTPLVVDLAAGVVVDCMDLRDFRTYDRAGKALFPREAGTTRVRATMRAVGGRWRLADFETEGSGCRR